MTGKGLIRFGEGIYYPFLLILFCICYGSYAHAQTLQNGVADLRGWNFETQNTFQLDGDWEFYPNKFVDPTKPGYNNILFPQLITVPNKRINFFSVAKDVPVFGYGTYRLRIILDSSYIKNDHKFALLLTSVVASYKIWIDTSLVETRGGFKEDNGKNILALGARVINFYPRNDTTTITIQYENYIIPFTTGIVMPVSIGLDNQIVHKEKMRDFAYLGGAIFCFATGLFFIFLIILSKEKLINILSLSICFLQAVRFTFDEAYLIKSFFPHFDPEILLKITCAVLNGYPLIIWLAYSFFPHEIKKRTVAATFIIYGLYTLTLIFTPFSVGARLVSYIVVFSILLCVYLTFLSYKAYRNKREFAGLFLFIMIFTVFTFSLNMFVIKNLLPIGSLVHVLLVAYLATKKTASTHNHVIKLSSELQTINENLEVIIDERTKELNTANDSLKKLNFAKDRFISILSHDLRGPLNNLIGLSKRLVKSVEKKDDDQIINYSKMINESAVAGHQLAENLLEWSLIQSGIKAVVPKPIDLNDIVDNLIYFYKNESAVKNISLVNSINEDLTVFADPRMTGSILRNIISNAIKFTPHDGRIEIAAERIDSFIHISVKDTGVGMPPEAMENLFRIDKKVYTLGTDDEPGTGFGLIIAKEFTEYNGGVISVESETGKGTCVSFALPVYKQVEIVE